MSEKILLGFELGTAEPVRMRLTHTVVAAMTQFGKTTTLEAIISRSGRRAVAFKTKRGEAGFTTYHETPPYFKAGSGWQYVEALVNVALGEKVKYEPGMRGAIMRVSRGGFKDLRELLERAEHMAEEAKREFQRDIYMKLTEYLRIVVPELEQHKLSETIRLGPGVNVMDLSDMRRETQSLVIASVLELAAAKLENVIIVVPEAWEHIPQGRATPVKLVAANFIRKGAAIGNYLLVDSQDIAGIDKEPLRQCDNWILGRQKDKREVDRTLEEIFRNRPSAEEIMTLPRGVFYACLGDDVRKVYVQPSWLDEATAKDVALGKLKVEEIRRLEEEDPMLKEELEKERRARRAAEEALAKTREELDKLKARLTPSEEASERIKGLEEDNKRLKTLLSQEAERFDKLKERVKTLEEEVPKLREQAEQAKAARELVEALRKALGNRSLLDVIADMPPEKLEEVNAMFGVPAKTSTTQLNLESEALIVQTTPTERVVEVKASEGWPGKILQVMLADLPDARKQGVSAKEISDALTERGWPIGASDLAMNQLKAVIGQGLVVKTGTTKNTRYRLPREVKFLPVN